MLYAFTHDGFQVEKLVDFYILMLVKVITKNGTKWNCGIERKKKHQITVHFAWKKCATNPPNHIVCSSWRFCRFCKMRIFTLHVQINNNPLRWNHLLPFALFLHFCFFSFNLLMMMINTHHFRLYCVCAVHRVVVMTACAHSLSPNHAIRWILMV